MKNTKAIFIKQIRSLIKSPALLAQGVFFALVVLVMTFLMGPERECDECIPAYVCETCLRENPLHSLPTPTIAGLFTVMFVGMALMGSSSALVLEDKTTHNLRFMTMAGMKPFQYLVGTAAALFIATIPVLFLFSMVGRYFGAATLWFMLIAVSGAAVSILLGIAMGLSKMPALAAPISMIIGFGPMFSSFNESLARWFHYAYTQQINLAIYHLGKGEGGNLPRMFMILGISALVIMLAFVWMHRKGELRW
ncbi:MAG: ABC transporter permease [Defluviitaleaceae bacterium]|nr:ABC transporter permease [Defluviitaleaceae bacterium]